jgi:flagellin-like hook-associated protein FlgL
MLTQVSDQMDSYLALAMDVANTQYDSKYVFGGTATSSAPYVRTGMPQQVTYQGNAESIKYQVGDGITSVVNITGAAAFNSTGKIDLTGVLDNSAAVNTSVTTSVSMTDANGASHAVELKFQKTDANTWAMSAALPSGATDATLSGGTATLTFDSSTGALSRIVRGAPLVLTPAATGSRAAAPAMTAMISADSLTEGIPSGGSSSVTGTHTTVSVFNKLIELRDKLKAGVEPTADDIAMVSMMQDVVQREEARAGSLSGNLSSAGSYLTAQNTRLLDLQSAKQDADLTEIGLRLKLEQTTLDAALSAAANIIPKSLLDYLT